MCYTVPEVIAMPASKAQQKAVAKYMKENYDEIKVRVSKGKKARLQAHAEAQGESVNSFINGAISLTMSGGDTHMKIYTIIGGVNGVGKSSFTGVLKGSRSDLGIIIDVDKITAELGGNPITGGRAAISKIRECLEKRVSFTQETTLSGYKTEQTAKQAREAGYYVRLYYVALDTPQECLARIENRVKRGGHNIPENDVERRFAGRWEAVEKILPYCDEAEFYDNDNGFVKVAEYVNGELLTIGESHPLWLDDLKSFLVEK